MTCPSHLSLPATSSAHTCRRSGDSPLTLQYNHPRPTTDFEPPAVVSHFQLLAHGRHPLTHKFIFSQSQVRTCWVQHIDTAWQLWFAVAYRVTAVQLDQRQAQAALRTFQLLGFHNKPSCSDQGGSSNTRCIAIRARACRCPARLSSNCL
jgi:hypothetical protein